MAVGSLVVAAVVVMSSPSWAVFIPLGPSKDEWGLKYDVQLTAGDEMLSVAFTLESEGRLKPVYSYTLIVFSDPDSTGGRTYLVKEPIALKAASDGKRTGQAKFRKEYLHKAIIRVLTLNVDGKHQSEGARYYDIELKKFLK